MSAIPNTQFGRKCSLLLVEGGKALDLSAMHFRFQTKQDDEESPNNCMIRVFNLSEDTVKTVQREYSRVILQGGYENHAAFGVIFDGTIKQFRIGKDAAGLNTYLDILAADGDVAYNFSVVNRTLAAGSNSGDRIEAARRALAENGVGTGVTAGIDATGGVLPRGKVLFGMAKAALRAEVQTLGATWSIQDGKLNIIGLTNYLPGEAVVLNSLTGLIGRAEQTQDGIRARCLINPKITVGGLVKIDQASINRLVQQDLAGAPLAYNQWAGLQLLASVTTDGIYRVYVAEHVGDTRGQEYYSDLICLTVNPVTNQCKAYG